MLSHRHLGEESAKRLSRTVQTGKPNPDRREHDGGDCAVLFNHWSQ